MKIDELRALPKISLHDHLDGGVRPATILELADAAGIAAPAQDAKALSRWFAKQSDAGSLVEYLKTFELVTSVMQSERALTRIAREFVADLAADGVIYGEMRWAPEQHLAGGLDLDAAVRAVQRGIEEGEDEADAAGRSIRVGQILSAMRPDLSDSDFSQAVVAGADKAYDVYVLAPQRAAEAGTRTAVIVGVVVVIAVIVIAVVLLMRRARRRAAETARRQAQLAELEQQADIALVRTDDLVRTSEQEMQYARAQFGDDVIVVQSALRPL